MDDNLTLHCATWRYLVRQWRVSEEMAVYLINGRYKSITLDNKLPASYEK